MAMPPKKPMPPKGKPAPKKSAMDDFWAGLSKPASGAQQVKEMQGALAYKGKPPAKPKGPPPRNPKQGSGLGKQGGMGEALRIMGPGDKPKGKKKK